MYKSAHSTQFPHMQCKLPDLLSKLNFTHKNRFIVQNKMRTIHHPSDKANTHHEKIFWGYLVFKTDWS